MSLSNLCAGVGMNPGTMDCPVVPGVAKYLAVWNGKLTKAQLAQGLAVCKASLIADSKRSKYDPAKLMLFPFIDELTNNKEQNTEASLASGFTQVTREGLPKYAAKVRTDLYQVVQLRKINNQPIRYAFIDDKNLFLGTGNDTDDLIGRAGRLFTDGIDVHGYANVDGESMVAIQADNAFETFDMPKCIKLDGNPEKLFKRLKDVYLYETAAATSSVVTPATAATRTVTITAIGSDGDIIDIQNASAASISGGAVSKTSSESTTTLLAAKVAAAITAATGTNGGYTATNSAAVITITAPASLGATVNSQNTAPVVTGGITASSTAFSGGVTGTYSYTLHLSAKMQSPDPTRPLDFFSDYGASALGTDKTLWKITRTDTGATVAVTTLAVTSTGFDVTITPATMAAIPSGTTILYNFVAPPLLDAALVVGIEGNELAWVKP